MTSQRKKYSGCTHVIHDVGIDQFLERCRQSGKRAAEAEMHIASCCFASGSEARAAWMNGYRSVVAERPAVKFW